MARYQITAPDGNVYEITAPDDAPEAEVLAYAQRNYKMAGAPAAAKPDFSNVRGGSSPTVRDRPKFEPGAGLGARVMHNLGSAVGMGDEFEQFGLGLGRNIDRTYRGVKQLAAGSVAQQAGLAANALESVGLRRPAILLGRNVAAPLARVAEQERQAEIGARQIPNAGPAMTVGDITGTVGSLLGPGALLRGTSAAPVFLPQTLAGNALQGGVIGALQPVTSEGERGANTGIGLLAGYGGALIPRAIGAGVNAVRRALPGALTTTDRLAGTALMSEATNPGQLTFTPSAVAGSQRTLGEATLDPGLMALENTMRSQNPAMFTQIDRANNAARMGLLGDIAGTDAELLAAQQARDTASGGLLDRVYAEGAANAAERQQARALLAGGDNAGMARLQGEIAAISGSKAGNEAVQSALEDVRRSLAKSGDSVAGLRNVRDYIGVLLSGKAGADKGYAKAASRELIRMREAIDAEIAARAPTHPAFLQAHQAASGPINRMEVGRELMNRAGAVADPETGVRTLTPFQFSKAMNDLDAVAQEATGFNKAKAAEILLPEQLTNLKSIQDDLERVYARANTRPAGSPTYGLQEAGKRLAVRSAARAVPMLGGAVDFLEQQATQRMQQRLAYLVANPAEAQRVLQALKPRERAMLTSALAQFSRTGGALVPALTE